MVFDNLRQVVLQHNLHQMEYDQTLGYRGEGPSIVIPTQRQNLVVFLSLLRAQDLIVARCRFRLTHRLTMTVACPLNVNLSAHKSM